MPPNACKTSSIMQFKSRQLPRIGKGRELSQVYAERYCGSLKSVPSNPWGTGLRKSVDHFVLPRERHVYVSRSDESSGLPYATLEKIRVGEMDYGSCF